jgi:heme/copper-type cytochrome/quinol oxidase subunit 2
MLSKFRAFLILAFILVLLPFTSNAQCAMCRASLQNDANKAVAEGVNDGIVYLMAIPYILVGIMFFVIYKMRLKKAKK